MIKKCKKTRKYLNYLEHLLILVSTVTGFVSISAFALLVCAPVGIASSALEIEICAVTERTEKYKSIINKKKEHDKVVLLGKDNLNTIEVLISNAFIDSYISHEEFVSAKNILREYNEIKNSLQYIKAMETFCVSCKKNPTNGNSGVTKTEQNRLMLS